MYKQKPKRQPTLAGSLLIFLISISILIYCVVIEKQGPYIPLLLSSCVVLVYGWFFLGIPWHDLRISILRSISESIEVLLIICMIGVIIGIWIASGTIPVIIYYGLGLFSTRWFFISVLLLCSLMSIITGSSWTTIGTIGLAFLGIGNGLGIPPAMTAGVIVCGAFFGDKQSPMSDSTNFAAAVAGTDLYAHTRSMLYTTGPAYLITAAAFTAMGLFYEGAAADPTHIVQLREGLASVFWLNPVLLLPFFILMYLIIKKFPALPTLMASAILGLVVTVLCQRTTLGQALQYMYSGFECHVGIPAVDNLLTRGGMISMTGTLLIMLMSLTLAGLLHKTQVLHLIIGKLGRVTRHTSGLIITTLICTITLSFFAADPYLAMLLPAKALMEKYDRLGIDRSVLSRTLEDGGTIICPMVPWGTSGIYCATTLGMSVGTYLPFYLMGFLTPLVSIICAIIRFGVLKADPTDLHHHKINPLL